MGKGRKMFTLKIQDIIGIVLLVVGIAVFMITRSQLSGAREENARLETKAVVTIAEHGVEVIENNQSIIFKKEKEVKDEEIPSTVGTHTIDIR